MKILVYGAGVQGSFLSACLHDGGHDVSILARGQRLADIREHGILLENALTGEQSHASVKVVQHLAPEDAYDWVLVTLRKNQLPAVLPVLAASVRTPNVVFMMNNAAGPADMVQALGADRVLLGFPGTGGVREGPLVRYVGRRGAHAATVTIGELHGSLTPRLEQLVAIFADAGLRVRIDPNMGAWLKTHVALVSPLANALYMAGGDIYRLAATRDALVLLVRAIREGLQVLRALDIPVRPPLVQIVALLPEPVLVSLLRRALATEVAELAVAGHANAARDEMTCLANEFQALALSAGVPTPAIDCLYRYLDLTVPPIRQGSSAVPVEWRGVWIMLGSMATLLAIWKLCRLRRRR
jgi:2-dehydropantoate 2-reductase